jgi:hypothetical protein
MDILTTVDVREEIKKSQQREINEMNRPGKETVLAIKDKGRDTVSADKV